MISLLYRDVCKGLFSKSLFLSRRFLRRSTNNFLAGIGDTGPYNLLGKENVDNQILTPSLLGIK